MELEKTERHEGGYFDRRPCAIEGKIKHPTSAFNFSNVSDITMRNCEVEWGKNPPPYYTHAVHAENVRGLEIEGLRGKAAFPNLEAVKSI